MGSITASITSTTTTSKSTSTDATTGLTTSSKSTAAPTATPGPSFTSSTIPSSPANVSQRHASNLGPGAKAGIGVGAAVAGIAIVVGAFILYRRRKSHSNNAHDDDLPELAIQFSGREHPEMSNSAAPEWPVRDTLVNAPLSHIPDPSVQQSVSTATLPVDSYQTEKVAVSGPSTVTYRQSDADELGQ